MGLLFKFAFECFQFLSWPLFAIVYPLCASIQAIETNSNSDTEKLITYWVCFSLILLFEHAFQQLLHWLPYWLYMKLIIVGFLVTPCFDGSFYICSHLVRPCLSMNPHHVLNWLMKLLETLVQDNPLTEAKRESKETEPETQQNLLAFKPTFEQLNVVQKDINAVEITEKKELSASKPVRQTEPDFTPPRTAKSVQIAPTPVVGGKDLIASKKLQMQWICATSDKADLISQSQGKPKEQGKVSAANNSAETGAEISDFNSSQALWTCVLCNVKCTGKLDLISHFQGQRHAKAFESLKGGPISYFFKPWTCGICQVTVKNKNDLILHLQSRRHSAACEHQKVEKTSKASSTSSENNSNFSKCEEMNLRSRSVVEIRDCKWWCTICNISCTGEKNMNLHLHGSKHLARTEAGVEAHEETREEAREVLQWTRVTR